MFTLSHRLHPRSCILQCCRFLNRKKPPPGKPPILPPAKTKRYRIVHVPWQDFDDVQELLWRRLAYNSAIKTIRQVFKDELALTGGEDGSRDLILANEHEEFVAQLRQNEIRNKEIAEQRKLKELDHLEQLQNEAIGEVFEHVQAVRREIASKSREVETLINETADFVTEENYESKILEALETPIDYSYAIDVDGNVYSGNDWLKYFEQTPPIGQSFISKTEAPRIPTKKLTARVVSN